MDKEQLVNQYLEEILEANKSINLTRITDDDHARLLHIEDSLIGLPELTAAPEGPYGDLGSGGGFPGVPLAVYSGRDTTLVDSVKKKMACVNGILQRMGLDSYIHTSDDRIEDLALDRPQYFSVLTARALSKLVSLIELASPLLAPGGQLICYKAHVDQEEIDDALAVQDLVGMKLVSQRETLLSDGETKRSIIVFEKAGKSRIKLPRRMGLAQKSPLKPRS